MSVLAVACAMAGSYGQLVALRAGAGPGHRRRAARGHLLRQRSRADRDARQVLRHVPVPDAGRLWPRIADERVDRAAFRLADHVRARRRCRCCSLPFLYFLPESPRWLAGRGRRDEAAGSLRKLGSEVTAVPDDADHRFDGRSSRSAVCRAVRAGRAAQVLVITAALWFLTSLVSFGLLTWVPSIYVGMFNIPIDKALTYNSIVAVSIFLLPMILRQTIDRIGRRPPPMLGTAIGGVALLGMIFSSPKETGCWWSASRSSARSASRSARWCSGPIPPKSIAHAHPLAGAGHVEQPRACRIDADAIVVGGVLQVTGSVTPVFLVFGLASLAVTLLWLAGHARNRRP